MNDQILARLIKDLIDSREIPFKKAVKIPGHIGTFTISVDYKTPENIRESISIEDNFGRAQTISALPHGAPCSCCNGSGRSS